MYLMKVRSTTQFRIKTPNKENQANDFTDTAEEHCIFPRWQVKMFAVNTESTHARLYLLIIGGGLRVRQRAVPVRLQCCGFFYLAPYDGRCKRGQIQG